MASFFALQALAVLAFISSLAGASDQASVHVKDSYIITLKQSLPDDRLEAHLQWVDDTHQTNTIARRNTDLAGLQAVFNVGEFRGYGGHFDEDTIKEIRTHPEVVRVERNQVVGVHGTMLLENSTWGLGTVSSRKPGRAEYAFDSSAGEGTWAYVLDTGINVEHGDFGGRAVKGANCGNILCLPGGGFNDTLGHGTHVAGIIAGTRFGVAKKANIVDVKIARADNTITVLSTVSALNWAFNDMETKGRTNRSIINLSIGGQCNKKLNWPRGCPRTPFWGIRGHEAELDIIEMMFRRGVLTVVAAGNDNTDASWVAPAAARNALTVGAIDRLWSEANFSNFGRSVDILAPGVGIISAGNRSNSETRIFGGTSMATPHVTGLALYLKALENITDPEALTKRILGLATNNTAGRLKRGSPSLVINNGIMDKKLNDSWGSAATTLSTVIGRPTSGVDMPMPTTDRVPPYNNTSSPPWNDTLRPPIDDLPRPPISDTPRTPPIDDMPRLPFHDTPRPPMDMPRPPIDDSPRPPIYDVPRPPINDMPRPPVDDMPKLPLNETSTPPTEEMPRPPINDTPKPPVDDMPKLPFDDASRPWIEDMPRPLIIDTPRPPTVNMPTDVPAPSIYTVTASTAPIATPFNDTPMPPIDDMPKLPFNDSSRPPIIETLRPPTVNMPTDVPAPSIDTITASTAPTATPFNDTPMPPVDDMPKFPFNDASRPPIIDTLRPPTVNMPTDVPAPSIDTITASSAPTATAGDSTFSISFDAPFPSPSGSVFSEDVYPTSASQFEPTTPSYAATDNDASSTGVSESTAPPYTAPETDPPFTGIIDPTSNTSSNNVIDTTTNPYRLETTSAMQTEPSTTLQSSSPTADSQPAPEPTPSIVAPTAASLNSITTADKQPSTPQHQGFVSMPLLNLDFASSSSSKPRPDADSELSTTTTKKSIRYFKALIPSRTAELVPFASPEHALDTASSTVVMPMATARSSAGLYTSSTSVSDIEPATATPDYSKISIDAGTSVGATASKPLNGAPSSVTVVFHDTTSVIAAWVPPPSSFSPFSSTRDDTRAIYSQPSTSMMSYAALSDGVSPTSSMESYSQVTPQQSASHSDPWTSSSLASTLAFDSIPASSSHNPSPSTTLAFTSTSHPSTHSSSNHNPSRSTDFGYLTISPGPIDASPITDSMSSLALLLPTSATTPSQLKQVFRRQSRQLQSSTRPSSPRPADLSTREPASPSDGPTPAGA
ncbi:hypothetical protein XA68_18423 [Ophiocordyceps unilateralis]|uniref:Peptidase S8/S53 domain-containing protein n=1 Tax=Ophiocordyceps unilateralis TaxID=268505 RepID=A0A2A9PHM7_OPHUN|nr:hypothetical protein XA68_18423 [Ophiocordyceps unilateralis]